MDRVKRSRIGQFNAHVKCAQIENSRSYCINACNLSRSELAFSYVTNRSKISQAIRVKNGAAYRVIWAVYFLRYLWLHGKEKPKFLYTNLHGHSHGIFVRCITLKAVSKTLTCLMFTLKSKYPFNKYYMCFKSLATSL